MTKPLNQLLEEAMKKCDSTMKETIDDYLYLRREASNDLDELRKALEERKMNHYNLLTKHWSPYKRCVLIGQIFLIILWMIR